MKLKLLLPLFVFCLALNAQADIVSFKTPEINGKIRTDDNLVLTDWQVIMSCHFDVKGVRKESVRYPHTILKKISGNQYSLYVKKGSLSEMLPGWKLLTCAYKLLLIGKNLDLDKNLMGEIYLLGQEFGEMDPEDLKDIQNREYVEKVLTDKTRELSLTITEGGIVSH